VNKYVSSEIFRNNFEISDFYHSMIFQTFLLKMAVANNPLTNLAVPELHFMKREE
jgi:hypothetical protein